MKYVATLAVETIVDLDAIEQGRSQDVQMTSKDILYIEAKENVKDNPSAGFIAASAWALSR